MELENEKQELHHKTRKPVGQPLDQLRIEIETKLGDLKLVPALHIGFSEGRHFICYKPPPNHVSHISHGTPNGDIGLPTQITSQARIEEWLERMEFLEEDLHWLLHLPPHRFWSQVIYDESLQRCLESYLCYAPRYYDIPDSSITEEMSRALQHIYRLVFMVFLRMSTYKESKSAHLGQQAFGEIVYENFLFDIPKMMDLCVLYGQSNRELLQKMIKNIFDTQPFYIDDLIAAIPTILDVFDTIQEKFGLDPSLEEENTDEPRRLSDSICSPLSQLSWSKLKDLIFYLVDTSATLSAFIDIYPPSTSAFHKQGTAIRISNFYEAVFPSLKAELQEKNEIEECKSSIEELNKRLLLAKSCLIKTFRDIVFSCCIQPLLDGIKDTSAIEDFLQIMNISVTEKSFICDYQQSFPFEEDLGIISQACGTLDSTRIEYIMSSIYSSFELLGKDISFKPIPALFVKDSDETDTKESLSYMDEVPQIPDSETNHSLQNGDLYDGACASPRMEGIELDCLVTQVLEVLGDLGIGFVEKCLEYYNYNPEKVISVILDDNLPVTLKKLDKRMQSSRHCAVISERKNIYDNDEFDIFNRDTIDKSRIHKGKRNTPLEDISSLLKKENSAELREVYQKYSIVEDALLYDDEYDDTYDYIAPEAEPPRPGDILYGRAVTTPRVLEVRDSSEEDHSPKFSSENEDSRKDDSGFQRDQFIENPAEVRNRLEQKRQQQQQSKRYDVKGKARGQGQDQSTLHNRHYKEKHKSSVANHSRRYQHDRKVSRGMFPS